MARYLLTLEQDDPKGKDKKAKVLARRRELYAEKMQAKCGRIAALVEA